MLFFQNIMRMLQKGLLKIYITDIFKKLQEQKEKYETEDFIFKRNTQCQFRAGFEHILKYLNKKEDRVKIMLENIGLSFFEIPKQENEEEKFDFSINERFYLEDLAIGYFRPWFNLDSER